MKAFNFADDGYAVFGSVWKLLKTARDADFGTDGYWDKVIADGKKISGEYGDRGLPFALVIIATSELDRRSRLYLDYSEDFEKGGCATRLFNDFWALAKKHLTGAPDFAALVKDMALYRQKYKGTRLAVELSTALEAEAAGVVALPGKV